MQSQTNSGVSLGECHMLFNTYCINESNPINPKCSQHWKYHDNVHMVEHDLSIKLTCQGMCSCILILCKYIYTITSTHDLSTYD